MNHKTPEVASSTKDRPWPLILFVTAILVWNLVAFNLISVFGLWTFGHVVPGFLLGEILSTSIIVGLFGRSWLSRLFFGICLSYAGIFALFFGQQMQFSFMALSYVSILNPTGSWAWIWGAFFVPLVCLIISVPFYLMRLIFGWQFVRDKAICVPREPIRLIDFFLVMASLASVLWMAQVPDLAWDTGSYLTSSNVIGSSCALCIYSAFVAVPATYLTFRSNAKLPAKRCHPPTQQTNKRCHPPTCDGCPCRVYCRAKEIHRCRDHYVPLSSVHKRLLSFIAPSDACAGRT